MRRSHQSEQSPRRRRRSDLQVVLEEPFYKRLALTYVAIIAIAVVMVVIGWQSKTQLLKALSGEQTAREVLRQVEIVQSLLIDMETGQRGYVATAYDVFLEPYNKARIAYPDALERLKALTSGDDSHRGRVAAIERLGNEKIIEVNRIIELKRDGGDAIGRMRLGYSRNLMDSIREINDDIREQEERDLLIESQRFRLFSRFVDLSFIGGILAIVITIMTTLSDTVRNFETNQRLRRQLDAAYQRLRLGIGSELDDIEGAKTSPELLEVAARFRKILTNEQR